MISSQHIDLLDASLRPRRERWSGVAGLQALAVLAVILVLADAGLRVAVRRATRDARTAQQQLVASQAPASPSNPDDAAAAELATLQSHVASTQLVRGAIENGTAGRAQGYSAYLLALARQARSDGAQALWITGFSVAADGSALDLKGRMTDPRLLPDYLHRLNEEPLFRGHAFAQLSLQAVPAAGDIPLSPVVAGADDARVSSGVSEFTLRAQAGAPGTASPLALALTGVPR
jgi:hypothetical protein